MPFHTEVGGPIQGSDQGLDQEADTSASGRIDRDDQPDHPRMGKLLLSLPCQKALPSVGWLDRPKALVAPHQVVAERSLEGISDETAAHGVQAGQPCLTYPFAADRESSFMKAGYGKTVRPVVCPAKAGMFSRRQTCRGRSQSPVVWIAEVMETETLKPIDKVSPGEATSHRAVTKVNALWPRK